MGGKTVPALTAHQVVDNKARSPNKHPRLVLRSTLFRGCSVCLLPKTRRGFNVLFSGSCVVSGQPRRPGRCNFPQGLAWPTGGLGRPTRSSRKRLYGLGDVPSGRQTRTADPNKSLIEFPLIRSSSANLRLEFVGPGARYIDCGPCRVAARCQIATTRELPWACFKKRLSGFLSRHHLVGPSRPDPAFG